MYLYTHDTNYVCTHPCMHCMYAQVCWTKRAQQQGNLSSFSTNCAQLLEQEATHTLL